MGRSTQGFRITKDARNGRSTERVARRPLDSVVKPKGLLFGAYSYVRPPFEAGKRVNDARFRDTVWDTSEFYEEGEIANSLKLLADAKGFEPPTSASGGHECG